MFYFGGGTADADSARHSHGAADAFAARKDHVTAERAQHPKALRDR